MKTPAIMLILKQKYSSVFEAALAKIWLMIVYNLELTVCLWFQSPAHTMFLHPHSMIEKHISYIFFLAEYIHCIISLVDNFFEQSLLSRLSW